jgi:ethanolamine permease
MSETSPSDKQTSNEPTAAGLGIREELLSGDERKYIERHSLKRPLGVLHIWGLAVGVVIAGEYFGWNLGLPAGGPVGLLIASLIVCLMYLVWVLTLTELSVAMPFSGGPLAYGRRAAGPTLGFLMGWSMFLEMLFATIGTGLAVGGYLSFIVNPEHPSAAVATACGLGVTLLFFLLQSWGVEEQGRLMVWLTNTAIVVLVIFCAAVAPAVRLERIWTEPLLPHGWKGVLGAVPYALWWLVCIETVALAAEEAREPERTLPRGLVLGQLTLVVLVLLTWFFAVGATPHLEELGKADYPLALVFRDAWPALGHRWVVQLFSVLALSGLLASFNGMLYSTSRQSFSLARAGYLPRFLGTVHAARRVPIVSLLVWSAVIAGFIFWAYFNKQAINVAILISTLTALIWYLLGVYCLFALRKKEASLERSYRVPVFPILPAVTAGLALFALAMYSITNVNVLPHTAVAYGVGLLYYGLWSRKRLEQAAPEEVSARLAREQRERGPEATRPLTPSAVAGSPTGGERGTGLVLLLVIISLVWMIGRSVGLPALLPEAWEAASAIGLFTLVLGCVCTVAWRSTHHR